MNIPMRFPALALLAFLLGSAAARATPAPPAVPQTFYDAFTNVFDPNSNFSQDSTGVALDKRGNIIVTGYEFDQDSNRYFYTAKYDALDGHLDWGSTFSGAGDSPANSVAVDSQGNVYVGGSILNNGGNEDFYLIKYSGTDGSTLWSQSYDGTNDGQDEIRKVIVDPNDNVVVTGISAGVGTGLDFETIKYNSSGVMQWQQRYDLASQDDIPTGLACDGTGNIYVAGSATDANQNQVFVTIGYTAAGVVSFTGTYTSPAANSTQSGVFTYGATGVAVDGHGDAITTGHYTDASGNDGYYTVKYAGTVTTSGSTPGSVLWSSILPSMDSDGTGGATSVAVDGSNNVVVAGALSYSGTDLITLVKYAGADGSTLWTTVDSGTAGGPTHVTQVTTDGGNNPVVVGDSFDSNGNYDQDIYVAKYDQGDGDLIWSSATSGSFPNNAAGVAVASDANSNIVITGIPFEYAPDGATGLQKILTIKYDRFLLETNDPLPAATGLAANPTIFAIDPPALADSNGFATLVTVNSGKAKPTAILTENAGGGLDIPAVQKAATPGPGTFSLFSDPVSAPDGSYAFAAKLAGVPGSQANSVWSNMSGALSLVLQQGSPVPGLPSANVSLIDSLSMRNGQLLALLKVSGPAPTSSLLLGLDSAGNGTPLVRSGQPVMIGGNSTTVKSITALSPTVLSPGDGRWQGNANSVVKILAANKATAICSVGTGGNLTTLLYTGEAASGLVSGATWKSFGLPGIDPTGVFYTTLGTLAPIKDSITPANDTVLVTSSGGGTFTPYLQAGMTYTALTDPIVNSSGDLATIASLAGSKKTQVLLYGNVTNGLAPIAQIGDSATDVDGNVDTPTYAAFVDYALPSGVDPAPVFVAKLAGSGVTSKTNMGLWAYGSAGTVRRLLRTGDVLGTRTVASFTVLKAPSKSFAAARNFNATASVAVMIVFTDKTQGLINIGIP
jgi:hypothetical protein